MLKRSTIFLSLLLGVLLAASPGLLAQEEGAAESVESPTSSESSNGFGWADGTFRLNFDVGLSTDELQGTGSWDGGGAIGDQIDVQSDLGLGEEDSNRIGLELVFGRFHAALSYTPVEFSGRNTITRTIRFGDVEFNANTDTRTEVDAPYYHFELMGDIFRANPTDADNDPLYWLGLSVGISAHVYDFSMQIDGEDPLNQPVSESQDEMIVIPALMANLTIQPMRYLSVELELQYLPEIEIELSDTTVKGTFYDANLTARVYVTNWLSVSGRVGVVLTDVEVESGEQSNDRVDADLELSHFQVSGGLGISF